MRFQYAGLVTKNDFLKCLLLNNSQLKFQKWLFGTVFVLLAVAVIILQIRKPAELAEILSPVFPSGLIGLIFMTFPWWTPYVQLTAYGQKGNIYRGNVHGVIDNIEITVNGTDVKASFRWNAYIDYKVSKDILLLYLGKNNFSIFMKNMFSDQTEWENFVAFAKEKVALNKKRA